jgi:hypothetical protein
VRALQPRLVFIRARFIASDHPAREPPSARDVAELEPVPPATPDVIPYVALVGVSRRRPRVIRDDAGRRCAERGTFRRKRAVIEVVELVRSCGLSRLHGASRSVPPVSARMVKVVQSPAMMKVLRQWNVSRLFSRGTPCLKGIAPPMVAGTSASVPPGEPDDECRPVTRDVAGNLCVGYAKIQRRPRPRWRRKAGVAIAYPGRVSPLAVQRAAFSLTSFAGNEPHGAHVRAQRHRRGACAPVGGAFDCGAGFNANRRVNASPGGDVELEKVRVMAGA